MKPRPPAALAGQPVVSSLTVTLRVRPLNRQESRDRASLVAKVVDRNLISLENPTRETDVLRLHRSQEKFYSLDRVFGPGCSQQEVFEATTQGLVASVLDGYNNTIFAYGATGAGKTYTMLGTEAEPGIVALTLNDLFQHIRNSEHRTVYRVTMAYLEVYNEEMRDLLTPSADLTMREDGSGAVVVGGLTEIEATSTAEVLRLLRRGNQRRTCEPTSRNRTSSRSHAVVKVRVEQHSRQVNVRQEVRTGVLFMVDLAGSERAAVTQNRGMRHLESGLINRSLLALGNCINALALNPVPYINFRDSKLTRLLKDALAGNCRTVMIAHVSPASTCFEETRNTLKYADRAKSIKTKVHANVTEASHAVSAYRDIIAYLSQRVGTAEAALEEKSLRLQEVKDCPRMDVLLSQLKKLNQVEADLRRELLAAETRLTTAKMAGCRHASHPPALTPSHPHSRHGWEVSQSPAAVGGVVEHGLAPDQHTAAPHASHVTSASANEIMALSSGDVRVDFGSGAEQCAGVAVTVPDSLAAECEEAESQCGQLQKRLAEVWSERARLQKDMDGLGDAILPRQGQLRELLMREAGLRSSAHDHAHLSAVAGLVAEQREAEVEEMRLFSAQLLQLAARLTPLLKDCAVPEDLLDQWSQARQQLAAAVLPRGPASLPALKGPAPLPALGCPSSSSCSSSLDWPALTGSKSNLLVNGEAIPRSRTPLMPASLSDHLPCLVGPHPPPPPLHQPTPPHPSFFTLPSLTPAHPPPLTQPPSLLHPLTLHSPTHPRTTKLAVHTTTDSLPGTANRGTIHKSVTDPLLTAVASLVEGDAEASKALALLFQGSSFPALPHPLPRPLPRLPGSRCSSRKYIVMATTKSDGSRMPRCGSLDQRRAAKPHPLPPWRGGAQHDSRFGTGTAARSKPHTRRARVGGEPGRAGGVLDQLLHQARPRAGPTSIPVAGGIARGRREGVATRTRPLHLPRKPVTSTRAGVGPSPYAPNKPHKDLTSCSVAMPTGKSKGRLPAAVHKTNNS